MSKLSDLKTDDKDVKQEKDSVGSSFAPLETALYSLKIILAFLTESVGEALALNILFETPEKQQLRQQFWMTSGKAKGKKNFYINKKTKEKHYLPGFNQANGIALLTCNKGINQMDTEKKTINVYNFDAGKEMPTEVDMVMELIGKETTAGVIKQIVDKNKLNDATGKYEPTGETRIENEVDKLFHTDGRTITEIRADKPGTFKDTWLEKWNGKTKDKTVAKKGVVAGAPKATAATAAGATAPKAESLFQD